MAKPKYAVCSGFPYEETYTHFITTNEKWAEWWCTEHNKCTDTWETYFVTPYSPPKSMRVCYKLEFGFSFGLNTGVLQDSYEYPFPLDEVGENVEENTFKSNGKGHSYEECLMDAKGKYTIYYLGKIFGFDKGDVNG